MFSIICNGKSIPINTKTILWINHPEWSISNYRKVKKERYPKLFVNHWDCCLTSTECFKILEKRKLSIHFLIDNDGTVIQLMDTNDIAYHASPLNYKSIGVEISNIFHFNKKYEKFYNDNFGPRPIKKSAIVHNEELLNFFWFYENQLFSLKELYKSINKAYNIPFVCPIDINQQDITTIYSKIKTFSGFCSHLHINKNKKDIAGLNLSLFLKDLKINQ